MKKFTLVAVVIGLLMVASAATVSAHSLEVRPPAHDGPVFSQVVSTGWAQAHCQALAPEKATANSDVITFSPDEQLPCPTGPGEGAPGRNN